MVYLMCGPRQLVFFQYGPARPKLWIPLVGITGLEKSPLLVKGTEGNSKTKHVWICVHMHVSLCVHACACIKDDL